MKRIYLILVLFQILSTELIAQEDSLEVSEKDSIDFAVSNTFKLDSVYYPPCILPWEPGVDIPTFTCNLVNIITLDSGCHAKGAKKDLKDGKALIWFPGGIVGCDFSSKADQEFQKRYRVQFVSPGCCRFGDEDPEAYNEVIFAYLDKTYGNGWRDELRHDAKGFVVPKTSNVATNIFVKAPLSMQLANLSSSAKTGELQNSAPETSVWWYILPTSGFALLLSLYFIKRKKD